MEEYNDSVRRRILKERFGIWKTFLQDLEKTAEENHTVARFPNSSTYIFSTGRSTFWMMDPSFGLEGSADEMRLIAELICQKISFIIVTHIHDDHCQFELVNLLSDSPVRWIVPQNCAEIFKQRSGIPEDKILVLAEGDSTEQHGIRITEHPGYHIEPGKTAKVLSGSYEITLPDGIRLFFPADVRDYHAPLPDLGHIDYTFGHVFLGREDATGETFSLLDDFCRFMMRTECRHLILAHLYEIGRLPRDLWTSRHAGMVRARMKELSPEIRVLVPEFGDALHLVKDPSLG
ncbi:MAG: MBL fold metallo-hydrolase [Lentisphaeria bacterium]|nr:MBL fold metallo-hydrolase [Lentisphaeria bacterium]